MRSFAQSALSISVAAALLNGCGETQPPIGTAGTLPQTSAIVSARSAAHRSSASYQQVYSFRHGSHPTAALINVNGKLYGTTDKGGGQGDGTVYSITTSGVHEVLYRFRGGADGRNPSSTLLNVNGTLYGTTELGGGGSPCYTRDVGCGTVYSISSSGTEKVLYAFKGGSDGAFPRAGLIDVKGTLYGTTSGGGSACDRSSFEFGCGTVFSVTTSGKETVLHLFAAGSDGAVPEAALIDVNGTLYGTTQSGGTGTYHAGTVFSISTSGAEKVVYSFAGGTDGAYPVASLLDVNGTLYGTTQYGGGLGCYVTGILNGCGIVFGVTTSGQETILHSFGNSGDGATPDAGLTAVNGVLYGTTESGLPYGLGTVFSITTSGAEKVLHGFGARGDGAYPVAGLIDVGGTLYGTTSYGGHGHGTVFALTP